MLRRQGDKAFVNKVCVSPAAAGQPTVPNVRSSNKGMQTRGCIPQFVRAYIWNTELKKISVPTFLPCPCPPSSLGPVSGSSPNAGVGLGQNTRTSAYKQSRVDISIFRCFCTVESTLQFVANLTSCTSFSICLVCGNLSSAMSNLFCSSPDVWVPIAGKQTS
jgi:hypothetical protein